MGGHVVRNTNPEELGEKLQVSGPMGFLAAVSITLQRLGRPYFFADAVPDFLLANKDKGRSTGKKFPEQYRDVYDEGEGPKSFQHTPHAIVHQYRKRPAKMTGRGTSDSSGHLRRQTKPYEAEYSDKPLPDSEPLVDKDVEMPGLDPDSLSDQPLWGSEEEVPDIIRDYVKESSLMRVTKWHYDVYVDFVCIATTGTWAEQMVTDLDMILHTFHHRSKTGSSNLHGWHVETVTGAPSGISSEMYDGAVARTITWRLRQTQGHALPAKLVKEIKADLYGEERSVHLP